jgi:NADH-quinone oxidoreductase subunit H
MGFALFFLGEYANMILMSAFLVVLFLGGWHAPLSIAPFTWVPGGVWYALKTLMLLLGYIWVRASLPRYRYDQLMALGWKVFLPLSLCWVVLLSGLLIGLDALPM